MNNAMKDQKQGLKSFFIVLMALTLFSVNANAAGVDFFLFLKDAFFEILGSYVALVIVAVIILGTAWRIYQTGDWGVLLYSGGALLLLGVALGFSPELIEFFKGFAPSTTVTAS